MRKAFKVFLWLAPLVFAWLIAVYLLYPATHQNYIVDFQSTFARMTEAFNNSLFAWWQDVQGSIKSDLANCFNGYGNVTFESGNFFSDMVTMIYNIWNSLKFAFVVAGKFVFYWFPIGVWKCLVFFGQLFDCVFNPSFLDIGSYYQEEWSVDMSSYEIKFPHSAPLLDTMTKLFC